MIVRDFRIEDLDAVLAIKRDPNVANLQYKFDEKEYATFLRKTLQGENKNGIVTTQFSSIEQENEIIGYVRHDHYSKNGTNMVECSFNLSSTFWGQGKMKSALTVLINQWMENGSVQHVFADHFRRNSRCERLLTGLQFDHQPISALERLYTVLQQQCFHWIIRRRLDASEWTQTRTANSM